MKHQNEISVNVVYPWTGTFIDTMIESTLGAKAHSSGCGFGEWDQERDMQFTLPDTLQSRKKIELLKRQCGVKVTVTQ